MTDRDASIEVGISRGGGSGGNVGSAREQLYPSLLDNASDELIQKFKPEQQKLPLPIIKEEYDHR